MSKSDAKALTLDPYGASVTLALILDALDGFEALHMPTRGAKRISWCTAYFAEQEAYPRPDTSDEHVLYFAEPAEARAALAAHPRSFIATVVASPKEGSQLVADLASHQADRALVLLQPESPLSLACVISLVQLRVQTIQSWNIALKAAARQDNAVQRLLDLGEDMFGNFMHVSDGSYALIGYTTGIEPVGPLNTALVRRGFHDAETIGKARREGIFGQWRKQRGVQVFEPNDEIPCRFMTYVMKRNGQYCGHVVMICNHTDVTALQTSLFELFALACNDAVNREISGTSIMRPQYHSYLARLVSDARCSQDFVNSQSAATGIPAEGCFKLCLVDAANGEFAGQLPFLASGLAGPFPKSYLFHYEGALLMLLHEATFTATAAADTRAKLQRFCASNDCLAYLSDDFSRIRDIRLAYHQVKGAERHRRHVDIWRRPNDDISTRRVFSFDDAFAFACNDPETTSELMDFCINHSALERIAAAQSGNEVSDLRFLHCYLFNERRTAPTAAQLGLHRNSVLYRANGLRDRYDIDLDNPSVRERLALCIKMKIAADPAFASELAAS